MKCSNKQIQRDRKYISGCLILGSRKCNGEWLSMGMGCLFGNGESVLILDSSDGCTLWITKNHLIVHFRQIVWHVNYILLKLLPSLLPPQKWNKDIFKGKKTSRELIASTPALSEKAMAPYSSTLAWKIPWMEEPGGPQSMESLKVGHNWVTSLSLFTFMHWRRKWQPTPVFLPGESQGQGSLVGCHLWGHTESDTTEAT